MMVAATKRKSEPTDSSPFATAALELWEYGLVPIPLGGDDGKKPLITKFTEMKWRPSVDTLLTWADKDPSANVGIVTELSNVTIVDIDDPALLDAMIERFGPTPLITTTPRGGFHLWYRNNDEPSRIGLDGLKVDIKAKGGMVVVPPSVRDSGPHAGKIYAFHTGDWSNLKDLPKITTGSLEPPSVANSAPSRVPEGLRNDTLFKFLRHQARHCDDLDALIDVAKSWNDDHPVTPLAEAEVIKTAQSVWTMQIEGRNWVATAGMIQIPTFLLNKILAASPKHGSSAVSLYLKLQNQHAAREKRGEPFPVVPQAMARDKVLPWSAYRIREALKVLLELELVKIVKRGGKGKGDIHWYRLCSPPMA